MPTRLYRQVRVFHARIVGDQQHVSYNMFGTTKIGSFVGKSGGHPVKPINREAMGQLLVAFETFDSRSRVQPDGTKSHFAYTADDCVKFGQLYLAAWGVVPTITRCKSLYSMPDRCVILRLFGTIEAYHAAIHEGGTDEKS